MKGEMTSNSIVLEHEITSHGARAEEEEFRPSKSFHHRTSALIVDLLFLALTAPSNADCEECLDTAQQILQDGGGFLTVTDLVRCKELAQLRSQMQKWNM